MSTLKAGLIQGRHDLPVEDYILQEVADPSNFHAISEAIATWLKANCHIRIEAGIACNSADTADAAVYVGDPLTVYVTGLTAATAILVSLCCSNGIPLTLMHYCPTTGQYVPQRV